MRTFIKEHHFCCSNGLYLWIVFGKVFRHSYQPASIQEWILFSCVSPSPQGSPEVWLWEVSRDHLGGGRGGTFRRHRLPGTVGTCFPGREWSNCQSKKRQSQCIQRLWYNAISYRICCKVTLDIDKARFPYNLLLCWCISERKLDALCI